MFRSNVVLLAEDDPNDVILVQRAWRKTGTPGMLQITTDGEETIEYLQGMGKFADRAQYPLPDLILLDIKMPRKTGLEVLEWIKKTGHFKRIPSVITSSSQLQNDINTAYDLGANAYLIKPVHFDELFQVLKLTSEFFIKYTVKAEVPEHFTPRQNGDGGGHILPELH